MKTLPRKLGTQIAATTRAPGKRPSRPRLAITMGDPAGIGPEVAIKAVVACAATQAFVPILIGDPRVFADTAKRLNLTRPLAATGAEFVAAATVPDRYRLSGTPRSKPARAACGDAAFASITAAVQLIKTGHAAALVTAPINKAHLVAAGHDFPGHTELLAELAGNVPVRMMMAGPKLRVVLETIHLRLADVPRQLNRDSLLQTFAITVRALQQQFGVQKPRIAVAGLNPHAGEDGIFGDEEIHIIAPAVRAAKQRGMHVVGPFAADGLFAHAATGAYDAIICMYHDQGLGPFKLLHFADGVNVTLGLPYTRTSPDHGTAFDIAGTGKADPSSMIAAVNLAVDAVTKGKSEERGHSSRRR